MNRTEFEWLRDLPGKRIQGDIRFVELSATRPYKVAENIAIENAAGFDLRMMIRFNPEVVATTANVHVMGVGPICRIDVNGPRHGDAGRTHKHRLVSERCPDMNLANDVVARPEFEALTARHVFDKLCEMASISFEGTFFSPDARDHQTT